MNYVRNRTTPTVELRLSFSRLLKRSENVSGKLKPETEVTDRNRFKFCRSKTTSRNRKSQDGKQLTLKFFYKVNGGIFASWSISSLIRIQLAQDLVRSITLIDLNKFLIHIISPNPLKKFSWTTFRWSIFRKRTFLVVIRLL